MASSKFLQTTESTLYLIIAFLGDIIKTAVDFAFRPKQFEAHIVIDDQENVTLTNEHYQPPLTYLLVFTVLCVIYGYWATRTELATQILLEDQIFKPFISILEKVWYFIEKLDASKLFIIMLPLLIFTVLFALSMTVSSGILKFKSIFKLNLYISSYFFGTYLFLHGLLFSYAMTVSSLKESLSNDILLILVLIWHLFIVGLILKTFHSFILLVKWKVCETIGSAILLIFVSTILFITFFIPLGLLIFPFFVV